MGWTEEDERLKEEFINHVEEIIKIAERKTEEALAPIFGGPQKTGAKNAVRIYTENLYKILRQ